MNRIASKSWLDTKILRQLIAKTSAESLIENDLIWRPQSPPSLSRFNGGNCKVTQVIYDTSLASLNIYIIWSINLQISVLENSAHRKLGPMTPVLVGLPVFLLGLFNIEVQLKFRLMLLTRLLTRCGHTWRHSSMLVRSHKYDLEGWRTSVVHKEPHLHWT